MAAARCVTDRTQSSSGKEAGEKAIERQRYFASSTVNGVQF